MEANDFVAGLKADTADKCKCNLRKLHEEFKAILIKLPAKDRGLFALNILRTLCWNIDKAALWRDKVDNTTLLVLSIDCVRETRQMEREDRVKTLACVYHLHRHVVQLKQTIPPELILKLSIMPFEVDSKYLLKEYYKTYWQIVVDRLTYVERLKTKANITKLLPKITEDIVKVIDVYDTALFCTNVIVFVVKRLHMLYSDIDPSKLVDPYRKIFSTLSQKDLTGLKQLPDKDILLIYTKLNDCLYVIAENSSKIHFKDNLFEEIAQNCAMLVAHSTDLFQCVQTFYISSFGKIMSDNTNTSYFEAVFNGLDISLREHSNSDDAVMLTTYPYINQLLRLYIEYGFTNAKTFTNKIQESCLNLVLFLVKKLKYCEQLSKCEDCPTRTGLHDAFRLSLTVKNLAQDGETTNIIDNFYAIITEQYRILEELSTRNCSNYHKFFRKLQTDVHNIAIRLNKLQKYEISIKLFDIYLKQELKYPEFDHKNISRAFFNKSICELDSKLYEKASIDALLSLIFARQDELKTEKYMSLVMDIKAREVKSKCDEEGEIDTDDLQLLTVLDACKRALDSKMYGDLTPFLADLKFSEYLRHEFDMYAKLWPSVAPVGGLWLALRNLARGDCTLNTVETESEVLEVLYDIVLETPGVVRSIHNLHFSTVAKELLDDLDNTSTLSPDEKLVHVALLFLQCEYDLAAASEKYGWKVNGQGAAADSPPTRTLAQEHAAVARAIDAIRLLKDLAHRFTQVSQSRLRSALQIFQIFVPLLQHMSRDVEALQLARHCCAIADVLQDRDSFLRNAGVLLTATVPSKLDDVIERAATWPRKDWGEGEISFLCDVAIYYKRRAKPGAAAKLLAAARARVRDGGGAERGRNLELAVGRLLDAEYIVYGGRGGGPTALTAANGALKHYLALVVTETKWAPRRLRSLTVRLRASASCLRVCSLSAALGRLARARAAAGAAPAGGAALAAAMQALVVDINNAGAAQIKIDEQLKTVLGVSSNPQPASAGDKRKQLLFTPKQGLETMRDNMMVRRNQTSPGIIDTVPAFKIPEFFYHKDCSCYACSIPASVSLYCKTCSVEAAMYALANENDIARNYFQGVLKLLDVAETKLKVVKDNLTYDRDLIDSVYSSYDFELKMVLVKVLIDNAFFEMKNNDFDAADEKIIELNEVIQERDDVDDYVKHDVLNVMAAFAHLKKLADKPTTILEDFENLNLISPTKDNVDPPSTPVSKPSKPPKPGPKIIVKAEELPQRKLIELRNLDLDNDDDFEKPKSLTRGAKKDKFKIPNPIIPNPILEEATPKPSRVRPKIIVTAPSIDMATPIKNNQIVDKENVEFFTPLPSTPDQFFTPMTSVKTYTKKTLRQNIVKNLERDLSTPGSSTEKQNKKDALTKSNTITRIPRSSKPKEEERKVNTKQEKATSKEDKIVKQEKANKTEANKIKIEKEDTIYVVDNQKQEKIVKVKTEDTVKKINKEEQLKLKQEDKNATVKRSTSKRLTKEDNNPVASRSRREDKRSLVRALSPGKMEKEEKVTRSRRHL